MLVLTRKINESVIIGNNIEVKVLNVRSDQVSLGFSAPREISVYRKEVHEAIQRENVQAASRDSQEMKKTEDSLSKLSRGSG